MRHLLVGLLGLGACAAPDVDVAAADPFRIVVMPDIQYVTLNYPEILEANNQWISDQTGDDAIAFVLQEGDIVHNNTEAEWLNAQAGFDVLGDDVPYALAVGNHDIDDGNDTTNFNQYFPLSSFEERPWFGGSFPSDTMDNAWFTFQAGGTSWLVLSVEWSPSDAMYRWANDLLDTHADHRVMVVTHAYLGIDGERTSRGKTLYKRVIKHHDNISFVFNGHYLPGGATRLRTSFDSGASVWQMFFNFQDQSFGGRGMVRVITLDPEQSTVEVDTYSPWLDLHEEGDDHAFVLEDVDLSPPG